MTATAKKARRRQAVPGQRQHKLRITLTGQELAAFRAAAAAEDLAVGAWLARAGMDQATGLSVPASKALRTAVTELSAAARQAAMIGRSLNQVVARLNSTGAAPGLASAIRMSEHALQQIDEATIAVTDALP